MKDEMPARRTSGLRWDVIAAAMLWMMIIKRFADCGGLRELHRRCHRRLCIEGERVIRMRLC